MMPRTATAFDPIATPPAVPDGFFWGGFRPAWSLPVAGRPVDEERTAALVPWDARVRCRVRPAPDVGGVPLQKVDGLPTTRTWHATRPPSWTNPFPSERLPLPAIVRRFGDPWADSTDAQWFAIDYARRLYFEASAIGPAWLGFPHPWRADTIKAWRLDQDYRSQGPGMTGAGLPLWPMVPRFEDLEKGPGGVQHALHFVAAGYSTAAPIGPAIKTDGTIPFHPLRAGERLRLRADRVPVTKTVHEAAWVWAALNYGFILTDKTVSVLDDPGVGHSTRLGMDTRVRIDLDVRLTDLEVVRYDPSFR